MSKSIITAKSCHQRSIISFYKFIKIKVCQSHIIAGLKPILPLYYSKDNQGYTFLARTNINFQIYNKQEGAVT